MQYCDKICFSWHLGVLRHDSRRYRSKIAAKSLIMPSFHEFVALPDTPTPARLAAPCLNKGEDRDGVPAPNPSTLQTGDIGQGKGSAISCGTRICSPCFQSTTVSLYVGFVADIFVTSMHIDHNAPPACARARCGLAAISSGVFSWPPYSMLDVRGQ